ncbi:hypothetical protein LOK49_LG06G00357 [Camellia lanceoleosa]|uniref:Uncharacterized protein n=1 Tax=Camellia lanceoleosa TaxID=1840588 RepID=A0ACC0HCC8_9ERIC|nr:hypothetical protein LOK49_LG06G00357 [Camellia lanceoleosa]
MVIMGALSGSGGIQKDIRLVVFVFWILLFIIDEEYSYHTEGLTCLTITCDSTLALTGSNDIPVHIVNITTGKGWCVCV